MPIPAATLVLAIPLRRTELQLQLDGAMQGSNIRHYAAYLRDPFLKHDSIEPINDDSTPIYSARPIARPSKAAQPAARGCWRSRRGMSSSRREP